MVVLLLRATERRPNPSDSSQERRDRRPRPNDIRRHRHTTELPLLVIGRLPRKKLTPFSQENRARHSYPESTLSCRPSSLSPPCRYFCSARTPNGPGRCCNLPDGWCRCSRWPCRPYRPYGSGAVPRHVGPLR